MSKKPPMSAPATLSLRLLGDPAVIPGQGGVKALERRAAGLLALVALEPGVTRARAAALLWPESDDARQSLRQQMLRLRRQFGERLLTGAEALFIGDAVVVDALHVPPEQQQQAEEGTLLGEFSFDDCEAFAAWLAQRRAQRRSATVGALLQRMAQAEASGELKAAVLLAEQLVQADVESEAHHRNLMRLHYLRGDVALAQAAYERLALLLRTRFAAEPAPETSALARTLRAATPLMPLTPAPALQPSAHLSVAVLRPPRMVGRQHELAALRTAWQQGTAMLLVGEPGLGKTRLLSEFARGRHVLAVQGRPGDAGVPYATLSRLLRALLDGHRIELPGARRAELARLLPELAPALVLPTDGPRLPLFAAVEAVLAQAGCEGVIVDDLHFADDASVEMLQALICASAGSHTEHRPLAGLRWVLAQRPGERGQAAAALRAALEETQALQALVLAPLTAQDMAELIDTLGLPELDAAALASPLVRHTGGNPLYALETLKQGLATGLLHQGRLPTPVAVGALIERRLRQLSEQALALARVAAIAGVDFDIGLAEQVMGSSALALADAWGELEAAQVLRDRAFAHDLVQDAALRSIPAPIASRLHSAVAAYLQAHGGVPARVAGHWLDAGQERQALPALHRAAAQSRDGLRRREELHFLMRAARIEEAAGELDSAWQTLLLASEAHMCVDTSPLLELEAARERLARTPRQRSELAQDRGDRLNNLGRYAEAEAQARLAVQGAREAGSAAQLAESLSTLATALAMQDRALDALAVSDEMLASLGHIHEPKPKLYSERGLLLDNLGRTRDAVPMHRRAVEATLRQGERTLAISTLSNLACSQMDAGRMHAALNTLEQALAMAGSHDDGSGTLAQAHTTRCTVLRELGRYGKALQAIEQARSALTGEAAVYRPVVDMAQAALWWQLGQMPRALQALPDEAALAALPRWLAARRWLVMARCNAALGHPALPLLGQAEDMVAEGGVQVARDVIHLHAAVARGTPADLGTVQAVGMQAQRDGREGVALTAMCLAAQLAATHGMPQLALQQAHGAREQLLRLGGEREGEDEARDADDLVTPADISVAEAWLCLARAYRDSDRPQEATEARRHGAAWLQRIERTQVPELFVDSFRRRNPVHRDLLAH
jgi:predicted ATPase/DNA-binding SARP family transcriptional activator